MKITSGQMSLLREIVTSGGVVTAPSPSASGTYREIKDLEGLGLLANRDSVVWEVTQKGLELSRILIDGTESQAEEDGCIVVEGQRVSPGDEVMINGKRGTFRFRCASMTSAGRVVVNTIGPVGFHQAFRNFYLEDVRLIPVPKPRRKRRVS